MWVCGLIMLGAQGLHEAQVDMQYLKMDNKKNVCKKKNIIHQYNFYWILDYLGSTVSQSHTIYLCFIYFFKLGKQIPM